MDMGNLMGTAVHARFDNIMLSTVLRIFASKKNKKKKSKSLDFIDNIFSIKYLKFNFAMSDTKLSSGLQVKKGIELKGIELQCIPYN